MGGLERRREPPVGVRNTRSSLPPRRARVLRGAGGSTGRGDGLICCVFPLRRRNCTAARNAAYFSLSGSKRSPNIKPHQYCKSNFNNFNGFELKVGKKHARYLHSKEQKAVKIDLLLRRAANRKKVSKLFLFKARVTKYLTYNYQFSKRECFKTK